jgi:hypothetical protein
VLWDVVVIQIKHGEIGLTHGHKNEENQYGRGTQVLLGQDVVETEASQVALPQSFEPELYLDAKNEWQNLAAWPYAELESDVATDSVRAGGGRLLRTLKGS